MPDREDVGRIVNRLAKPDRNVAWKGGGPFPEEATPAEAEDAAPQFIEIDGHDRRAGVALDFEDARLEGLQLSGAGDAAFGKDAHELAVFECGAGGFDGVAGSLRRVANGNAADDSADAAGPPIGEQRAVDHHSDQPRRGGKEEQAVDP
jgi:hypothetical protein